MTRVEQLRERAKMLRSLVGPGEIYSNVGAKSVLPGVNVGLWRDGDEFTLKVYRAANVLDAIDLGMLAEAFGVADGSESVTTRKGGELVTVWQWREALPVQVR